MGGGNKSFGNFFFSVASSLAGKRCKVKKAKNGVIREYIAPIRANQITGTTSDFKMGVIKSVIIRVINKI